MLACLDKSQQFREEDTLINAMVILAFAGGEIDGQDGADSYQKDSAHIGSKPVHHVETPRLHFNVTEFGHFFAATLILVLSCSTAWFICLAANLLRDHWRCLHG